ncbi:WG repeat-containing protein [Chryseobacterium tructae]|uniref:WG repeat-containing protein n=1 Tax=Chryseobacterium tructae TaxID=1037380 RepID=A0ABV7XUQ1_9FLAO|nr:WG repeat-containing protein [Chryseobacterium tructae]MDN3691610.1 WG repeat-containing protein [Chryseobacterium tructae]
MTKKLFIALFGVMIFNSVSAQIPISVPDFNTYKFSEGNKLGIRNREGILLKAEYDQIWERDKDLYSLTKSGKMNVFYLDRFILPTAVDEVNFISDAIVAVDKGEKSIYVLDTNNQYKFVLKTKNNLVVNNGFTLVLSDESGKKFFYFKNGASLPDKYSYSNIYNNVIMTSIDRKWGLIKDGREITPFIYDSMDTIGRFYKQRSDYGYLLRYKTAKYFIAELNQKFGIINVEGKIVLPIKYDKIVLDEETNTYTLYLNGKEEAFDGNK